MTNIHEDHLDRYADLDDYTSVKAAIARHQRASDWLVVNRDDTRVMNAVHGAGNAQRLSIGMGLVRADNALWIDAERFVGRVGGGPVTLGCAADLRLPGEHAKMDVLAAAGAALAGGVAAEQISGAIAAIEPVRDRLELVAEIDGVRFVNDTTATVPAAAIAGLRAYAGQRVIVIAGGSDKGVSFDDLAAELVQRAGRVVLLDGTATPALAQALAGRGFSGLDGPFGSMDAAVEQAARHARTGDVVLLSPGCASFGMFRNEFHRGEAFREAVARLKSREGTR